MPVQKKVWKLIECTSYVIDLDVRQSSQANDSTNIVKRAKKRFRNSEMLKKLQREASKNAAIIKRV